MSVTESFRRKHGIWKPRTARKSTVKIWLLVVVIAGALGFKSAQSKFQNIRNQEKKLNQTSTESHIDRPVLNTETAPLLVRSFWQGQKMTLYGLMHQIAK